MLYRISDLINSTTKTDTLLKRIVRETVAEMAGDSGAIYLANPRGDRLELAVMLGADGDRQAVESRPLKEGIAGAVLAGGAALREGNLAESAATAQGDPVSGSLLAVPLKVEGEVIGVLQIHSADIEAFSDSDEKLLGAIGTQAAKVIQTSRLYDRIAEQGKRIEALFEVGQALISPDPLSTLLSRITEAIHRLLDIRQCSVMVLNEARELVISAVSGAEVQYTQKPSRVLENIPAGDLASPRKPIEMFQVKKAPARKRGRAPSNPPAQHSALLSVPVFFHENLIGFLNIYNEDNRRLNTEELRLLDAFASLCGIAIENARRYERMLTAEQSIRQTDRLATLGILSAEIAHEIRNPISIISMLLHSLVEDKAVAPRREKDIGIISEKLERIDRIVTQVLNFGRKREPRLEWVDMNSVLDDLLFLVNHTLSARQIEVRKSLHADLPKVLGDRGDFDQIFLNLIMNAIEAMSVGGILFVRTSEGGDDGGHGGREVSVMIRDTGVGIEQDAIPQLFQPFFSTRREGFGLGLFVSNKLLGAYGGSINVKSVAGKGTTFVVSIPREPSGE